MKTPSTITRIIVLLGMLVLSRQALSQTAAAEAQLASAVDLVRKQYKNSFIAHPQLFNGPEYRDYAQRYQKCVGHQFFLSSDKQSGSVYYNDYHFTDVKLLYDVVLDQIVLQHATSPLYFKLINDNVQNFFVGKHYFTRLIADSSATGLTRTGFYEVLVDNSVVQLLARREKQMQEKLEQQTITLEFLTADKLFIKKAGVYYPANKKRSVTRLFADRSKEVQKYIQDNKLKFKKDRRETDIVQLTRYYGSLAPQ
ncbi:MAG TPA: hypothetical protein VF598_02090 [Hymenobacter sp.]|jgi:hypothetical protein